MRYLIILSCIYCFSVSLWGQDKYQIFYASGAASLSAEQEADLSKILQARPLSVLKIQPFTDDLGTDASNEVLAENRAKIIIQFVQKQGFEQLQFEQLPYERQALDDSLPVAEARQQLRRMDLYFYNEEEYRQRAGGSDLSADWQKFFQEEREKAQQLFSFSAQEDQEIYGKEGVRLRIAANSLVRPDGSSYEGEVKLILQEVLKREDMILQNLTTSSNGELIETGGMVYLAAKGENGEELSLAEGNSLTVGFPGAVAALPGMRVFLGPKKQDLSQSADIDWEVREDRALSTESKGAIKERFVQPFSASYFSRQKELSSLLTAPKMNHQFMEEPKAFKAQAPIYKGLRQYPSLEDYLAAACPKEGRSDKDYANYLAKERKKRQKNMCGSGLAGEKNIMPIEKTA